MTTKSALMALPIVALGWLGLLALGALLSSQAPAFLVMFPSESFIKSLPAEVSIVDASPVSISVAFDSPSTAAPLYHLGARLVLPSGLDGCSI